MKAKTRLRVVGDERREQDKGLLDASIADLEDARSSEGSKLLRCGSDVYPFFELAESNREGVEPRRTRCRVTGVPLFIAEVGRIHWEG